jgi:hypothetical protein
VYDTKCVRRILYKMLCVRRGWRISAHRHLLRPGGEAQREGGGGQGDARLGQLDLALAGRHVEILQD